jgi:two-component system cell cycle sensor histidine kinase/response regulator CckA
MGMMMVVFGVGLSVVARITNRSISEAFRLRDEKQGLLDRLSSTQKTLEETNHTLEDRVTQGVAQLEQQGEALRRAHRLETVGRLAGGIAHDFNNLLTVVLANVGLLARSPSLDSGSQAAVEEVHAAAIRGANLVRQLLAFSRRQRLAPRVIDLNALVREMDRLLTRLIGETVEMKTSLTEAGALVKADASQLEQVVVNLVTNARDAMPNGGALTIATTLVEAEGDATLPPGSYVVLSVTDTGVGMDAETRSNAFEPFFTTKELGRGTGLGLATVYGIVEQSGGRVSVESRPGEGTRFEIYLPRTSEAPGAEVVGMPVESAVVAATVLVAEDEPEVRVAIERMLRLAGHEVLAAGDGEQAVAMSRAHRGPIDLLVTDVVMPHMGGGPLARRLMDERPEMRVLFVSGYSWEGDLPSSDPARGIDFLQKPFDREQLMAKVAALLAAAPPVTLAHPRSQPARK